MLSSYVNATRIPDQFLYNKHEQPNLKVGGYAERTLYGEYTSSLIPYLPVEHQYLYLHESCYSSKRPRGVPKILMRQSHTLLTSPRRS